LRAQHKQKRAFATRIGQKGDNKKGDGKTSLGKLVEGGGGGQKDPKDEAAWVNLPLRWKESVAVAAEKTPKRVNVDGLRQKERHSS